MKPARVGAAIAVGIAVLYVLRLDRAAGLYVDDAWYIVLAQALRDGEGFRLNSSAATPILPAFPPGFPMLLVPVLAVAPDFPANVLALKAVSIAAMLGVAWCVSSYLIRHRGLPPAVAAVLAAIAAALPAFVFLATSTVMAEGVFTLSQLGLLLAIEHAASRAGVAQTQRAVIVSGLIGGAALLIRLAGVAGIVAAALYLGWRRGFRSALGFIAVVGVCYSPWAVYSMANASTPAERAAHGGSIAYGYEELLLMRRGGEPSSGRMTLGELPRRIAANIVNVFGRDAGALVFPAAYRGPSESGQEVFMLTGETGFRASGMGGGVAIVWVSSAVSVVMLAGFVASLRRRVTAAECVVAFTVAMVLLVPARTFRYVLPLAPFLIFYFFVGIEGLLALARRGRAEFGASFRISASCVLVLFALEHGQYIVLLRQGPPPAWLQDYGEVKLVTDWMTANLTREGPVATSNPGLVYLATGRRTLAFSNQLAGWRQLQDRAVPYAAALHTAPRPTQSLSYPLLFESPRLGLWVVEIPDANRSIDKK